MIEIPKDFLKRIDFYKPSLYSTNQFRALSDKAKFSYVETVTRYNMWCEELGLPERKIKIEGV